MLLSQTYLELINMDEYDSSKYAKVEDLGGEDIRNICKMLSQVERILEQEDVQACANKYGALIGIMRVSL